MRNVLGKRFTTGFAHRVLLTCVFLCLMPTPAQGSPVDIRGTRVSLEVPEGFVPSSIFPGVQHEGMTAAIIVSEMPSSFIEHSRQYNEAGLAKSNMKLLTRQSIDKDGLSGVLLSVEQTLRGIDYERWIFITGDTTESVEIAGYFPVKHSAQMRQPIQQALRHALWDSARPLDHFDGMGFRIDDVPSLRVVTRMSNSLVFTETGRMPDKYYIDALLMVTLKSVPDDTKLSKEFAESQFNKITLIENHELEVTQRRSVADSSAVIIEGKGRHRYLGYQVAVMQLILETDSGFLIAQGFTNLEDMRNDFEVFLATISSFRLELDENPS
ncbi:MAG: hypothetical protein AB8G18_03645 [Gammaproteobacteria bacterium]